MKNHSLTKSFVPQFNLNCPDDFNFAFDIVSNKYEKSEKTVFIAINKNGNDFEKIKQYLKNIQRNYFYKKSSQNYFW